MFTAITYRLKRRKHFLAKLKSERQQFYYFFEGKQLERWWLEINRFTKQRSINILIYDILIIDNGNLIEVKNVKKLKRYRPTCFRR